MNKINCPKALQRPRINEKGEEYLKLSTCPLHVVLEELWRVKRPIINIVFYDSDSTNVTFFSFLIMRILRRQPQLKSSYRLLDFY